MSDLKVRVLACKNCRTYETLPDFDGPPDRDEILAAAIFKHRSAGVPHVGQLFDLPEAAWSVLDSREQIKKRIEEQMDPGAETGLGRSTYAMVDNFKDDAMACFAQHQRNPACSDYKSEAKRLVPDTAAERKELGLKPVSQYDQGTNAQQTVYLCNYCPVHSLVQQAARKKAGMYDA